MHFLWTFLVIDLVIGLAVGSAWLAFWCFEKAVDVIEREAGRAWRAWRNAKGDGS